MMSRQEHHETMMMTEQIVLGYNAEEYCHHREKTMTMLLEAIWMMELRGFAVVVSVQTMMMMMMGVLTALLAVV